MPEAFGVGLALLMALMPTTADDDRAAQCAIPKRIPSPRAERPANVWEVRRLPVVGYTLALSWTPQYCAGIRGKSMQCDKRIGRFGFILHGLWPDGKGRDWPQWCAPASVLPREVLAENLCMTPSVQLMQHEWAKHGTCMAKRPQDYFDRARGLFERLAMPDMRTLAGRRELTAGQLAGAFARKNPGTRIDMIRVRASRYSMLNELWICLDTAFRPARCPAGKSGLSPNARIRIRMDY